MPILPFLVLQLKLLFHCEIQFKSHLSAFHWYQNFDSKTVHRAQRFPPNASSLVQLHAVCLHLLYRFFIRGRKCKRKGYLERMQSATKPTQIKVSVSLGMETVSHRCWENKQFLASYSLLYVSSGNWNCVYFSNLRFVFNIILRTFYLQGNVFVTKWRFLKHHVFKKGTFFYKDPIFKSQQT